MDIVTRKRGAWVEFKQDVNWALTLCWTYWQIRFDKAPDETSQKYYLFNYSYKIDLGSKGLKWPRMFVYAVVGRQRGGQAIEFLDKGIICLASPLESEKR